MTFEEKYEHYSMNYAIQGLNLDDILVLYNLVGTVYLKLKDKYSMLEVIDRLLADFDTPILVKSIREPLAIQVLHLLDNDNFTPSALNCKTSQEIKDTIYKALDNYLPF